jgi:hypothetical protein
MFSSKSAAVEGCRRVYLFYFFLLRHRITVQLTRAFGASLLVFFGHVLSSYPGSDCFVSKVLTRYSTQFLAGIDRLSQRLCSF